jgi:hypothetical protein
MADKERHRTVRGPEDIYLLCLPTYMFLSTGEDNLPEELKPSFKGLLSFALLGGIILRGCSLHEENGRRWVEMPMQVYVRPNGEGAWLPNVEFASQAEFEKFQRQALAALDRAEGRL